MMPRPHASRRVLIGFTGADGAGKSTQCALLEQSLRALGLRVETVHQYEPVLAPVGAIKRKVRTLVSLDSARARRLRIEHRPAASRPSSVGAAVLGRGFSRAAGSVFLGAGYWRALVKSRFSGAQDDVLILDRCYLDEIVRSQWRWGVGDQLGKLAIRALPVPDAVFVLAVDEAEGWGRKKEVNMRREDYAAKRETVESVAEWAATVWPLERISVTGRSVEEIAAAIWESSVVEAVRRRSP